MVRQQDGVQIETDTPYTGAAPVQEAEVLPSIEEIWQEMIRRINEVRRENGVSELKVKVSHECITRILVETIYISQESCRM